MRPYNIYSAIPGMMMEFDIHMQTSKAYIVGEDGSVTIKESPALPLWLKAACTRDQLDDLGRAAEERRSFSLRTGGGNDIVVHEEVNLKELLESP